MFDVSPLPGGKGVGVEIHGLRQEQLGSPEIKERLHALWIEHGLLVFRHFEGADAQIELSNIFGPCVSHPGKPMDESKEHLELVSVRYDPEGGDIYEVDGVRLGAWLPWHSDLIYVDKINHGGVLRPVVLSEKGGETGFADKIRLYDALPDGLKRRIEGLYVAYKWDLDIGNQKFGRTPRARVVQWSKNRAEMQSRLDQYPRVLHPMTFVQPETGLTVLNVSPWFALGIEGLPQEEGDELLETVVQHCMDERFAYYHHYAKDDMLLWDNWRMLHCANGIPANSQRWMQRTTIAGDYALGRLADSTAVIDERIRVNV